MTLRELEYLVALAKYRHFGRAAEACLVSQPTLSAQIRKLETELGTPLVERDSRSVMLTAAGREAADRARRILVEVQELKDSALRNRNPEGGNLKLGIFPTLGPYLLPHAVPDLRERFPKLDMLLTEEKTDTLLAKLRDGALDAVIVALPVRDEQIHTEFLFKEEFLLAVSKSHPLAKRNSLSIHELGDHNLMLLEEGHCLRDQALEVCSLSGAGEYSSFRATSLETLRQMVGADVGITLLPALATQQPVIPSSFIHLLSFNDASPSRQIAMCWRKSSPRHGFLLSIADKIKRLGDQLLDGRTH